MDMTTVRAGDAVWLPKENRKAWLDTDWIPPRPGHRAGKIGVDGHVWYVDIDGNGFDGIPLIAPLEGIAYDPNRLQVQDERGRVFSVLAIMSRDILMLGGLYWALSERIEFLEDCT